jgi:tRNA(Ile)-lysidine synthase
LIPLLARDWNPNVEQTLARMADWAQAEEQYWAETLPTLSSGVLEESAKGVSMDAAATARFPLAAQRRVLRRALEWVRGDLRGIDFDHVESLRALLGARSGSIHLPGTTATKSFGRVLLARAKVIGDGGRAGFSLALDAPGRFEIPGTSSALILRLLHRDDVKDGYNKDGCRNLDWDKVPKPLRLRSWRAGDRYRPVGRSGPKRLKAFFQEHRIESWRRAGWPVVTGTAEMVDSRPGAGSSKKHAETIVWTREFGPAEQFAAQEGAETLLEITEVG